jgi:glycosyltransferase involved in cell wall biosynthesis
MRMPGLPMVSVVIPVYNGQRTIGRLLISLLDLDYPANRYEIIVVDNRSTDHTCQIVEKYPVTLLHEEEFQSSYAARNRGISHARGEIIAFTDADCIADERWLRELVADAGDLTIGGFVGSIKGVEPPETRFERVLNSRRNLSQIDQDAPSADGRFELKRYASRRKRRFERLLEKLKLTSYQDDPNLPYHLPFATTANVAYRRKVFESIGLFDQTLFSGGDADFSWRIQLNSNYRLHPAPDAIIYHKNITGSWRYLKAMERVSSGSVLQIDKYVGLNPLIMLQLLSESMLYLSLGLPWMVGKLICRSLKSLIKGLPYPLYVDEIIVSTVALMGVNYGRIRACVMIILGRKDLLWLP